MSVDEDLVRRAADGDDRAFTELAARLQDRVFRVAFGMLGETHLADEVTQVVLVRLYRALPRFRFAASLDTWVYRVAVNACRDELRRERKSRRFVALDDHLTAAHPRLVIDPSEELMSREQTADLENAIRTLPPELREVVLLRYASELSYAEMSQVLGVPIGTLSTRLRRALASLGATLAPNTREAHG